MTLGGIAAAGGVSRYHMSRAFGLATGHSVMQYVRGRRLTEAARSLARGAPDILAVALDAGYGSHEAFTRAFRDQFGLTPETIRAQGNLNGNTDYICGVEVSEFSRVPAEMTRLRIPEHKYAVFTHREHISAIRRTWFTIFNKWLPESGYKLAEAPEFERYDSAFDPATGTGGCEIWIPVER
jgi:AraC-like DNA-binding protein